MPALSTFTTGSLLWRAVAEAFTERAAVQPDLDCQQSALLEMGHWLRDANYRFTTITPSSHRTVNDRNGAQQARDLRDVFGWNRPIDRPMLPLAMFRLMQQAGALEACETGYRSTVRYTSLGELLLVHSAYPTLAPDSVFFGPDSYRFATLIRDQLRDCRSPIRTIADIGCGTGVGGLLAAQLLDHHRPRLLLADISQSALRFAAVNAQLAGQPLAKCLHSDLLRSIETPLDLILCNPPYLIDNAARTYRDGGGALGCDLALRLVREALAALAPGGRLILYTGAPIVGGEDQFLSALGPLLRGAGVTFEYRELDPDVFGDELLRPAYREVERIAAVGLIVRRT